MDGLTVVGIVLIVVGIIAVAYQGFTYTTKERAIDIGPIEANVEKEHRVWLPPILGVLAFAAGTVLVIVGRRGRPRSA